MTPVTVPSNSHASSSDGFQNGVSGKLPKCQECPRHASLSGVPERSDAIEGFKDTGFPQTGNLCLSGQQAQRRQANVAFWMFMETKKIHTH
jgi:hypothetical protein